MRSHLRSLARFLVAHGRLLAALAVCLVLPLFVFASIAEDIYEQEPFEFEVPLMLAIHAGRTGTEDRIASGFSVLGSAKVMAPLVVALFVALYRVRRRLGYFVVLSLGGVATINFLLKQFFDRPRPTLWQPLLPENDASFPSGHSMFSAALAGTVLAILWPTPWRYVALAVGVLYVLGMMWSRVYIGVHYPTDVAAGAAFSVAWTYGLTRVLHVHRVLGRQTTTVHPTP